MVLNDIYHISMIIVGFGSMILGYLTLMRAIRRDQRHQNHKKRRYK